jgi:hypothetical protein
VRHRRNRKTVERGSPFYRKVRLRLPHFSTFSRKSSADGLEMIRNSRGMRLAIVIGRRSLEHRRGSSWWAHTPPVDFPALADISGAAPQQTQSCPPWWMAIQRAGDEFRCKLDAGAAPARAAAATRGPRGPRVNYGCRRGPPPSPRS